MKLCTDSGDRIRCHAEEFLLYAYLQTGQDGKAKQLVDEINPLADRLDAMARHGRYERHGRVFAQ